MQGYLRGAGVTAIRAMRTAWAGSKPRRNPQPSAKLHWQGLQEAQKPPAGQFNSLCISQTINHRKGESTWGCTT